MNNAFKKMFLVVKPDGMRYLDIIRRELKKSNFSIVSEIPCHDWAMLAHRMYERRLEQETEEFRSNFEIHVWLQEHLFGPEAVVLVFYGRFSTLVDGVHRVFVFRDQVRQNLYQKGDNRMVFLVKVDAFVEGDQASGLWGRLAIMKEQNIETIYAQSHKWDEHLFKYVHAPDSLEEFVFQKNVLEKIFDIQF